MHEMDGCRTHDSNMNHGLANVITTMRRFQLPARVEDAIPRFGYRAVEVSAEARQNPSPLTAAENCKVQSHGLTAEAVRNMRCGLQPWRWRNREWFAPGVLSRSR